ncbi:hypothetical protein D3C85_1176760 [compost metagenome]
MIGITMVRIFEHLYFYLGLVAFKVRIYRSTPRLNSCYESFGVNSSYSAVIGGEGYGVFDGLFGPIRITSHDCRSRVFPDSKRFTSIGKADSLQGGFSRLVVWSSELGDLHISIKIRTFDLA